MSDVFCPNKRFELNKIQLVNIRMDFGSFMIVEIHQKESSAFGSQENYPFLGRVDKLVNVAKGMQKRGEQSQGSWRQGDHIVWLLGETV